MTTYEYEVTFKKDGKLDYATVRAQNEFDAIREICADYGDITPVCISRIGN